MNNCLAERNSTLVIIPGGMTSQLQSLDVCVIKPFKVLIRTEYEFWFLVDDCPLIPGGKLKGLLQP